MDHFSENLSLLCSYYPSVSEVCRKLDIHRTQFNKYLHGNTRPNRSTLRRICDFFGVEEYEIFLPPHQFSQLLRVRPAPQVNEPNAPYQSHIEQLQSASSGVISRYAGYYFEYYYSMSFPGYILRALVKLHWDGTGATYKRNEILTVRDPAAGKITGKSFRTRYRGMAFYLGDRVFLTDYETLTHNEITHTILFPSYKSQTTYLTGLKLGAAAESQRMPICTRVVYEVLGERINLRSALGLCGLFHQDSDAIASDIKPLIKNTMPEEAYHFAAVPV